MMNRDPAGNPDSKNTIVNQKNIRRSWADTNDTAAGMSRAELLLLLDGFHERLDTCFEDLRTLPQTTTRLRARSRQSTASD
jgi:hypothetical protein